MAPFGIIEGFFGPAWEWRDRHSLSGFLTDHGFSFYVYAPKADSFFRKRWKEPHPASEWNHLKLLSQSLAASKVEFGVGISPFELHNDMSDSNRRRFQDKIQRISELGTQWLGIFLDDMKGGVDLAARQAEICEWAREVTSAKILFCPTYYSFDPVLDRVFGQRPACYLEDLGKALDPSIEIMWTCEKVVSPAITPEHLKQISHLLGRQPFIWDNFFANDGPKQCAYLKLKPATGRTQAALNEASGWALNPMNQFHLSKIAALAFRNAIAGVEANFSQVVAELCGGPLTQFIASNARIFCEEGLLKLQQSQKEAFQSHLASIHEPAATEIARWLSGHYNVGSECLTD